jgi:hypothetical protein
MSVHWELGDEEWWRLNAYVYLYICGHNNQNNTMQTFLIGATLLKLIVGDE